MSTLGLGGSTPTPPTPEPDRLPAMPVASPPPVGAAEQLRSWLLDPEYPPAALEVRRRSLGAARGARTGGRPALGAAASLSLPEDTLALSMVQPNVAAPDAFRDTVRSVLERAGIPLRGEISLVLPDPVARVSLLPAAELAGKSPAEAEDLVRFKLRKAVPFDIKEARVVYRLPRVLQPEAQAVAVVMARPVVETYEEVLRSLGLELGLVELTGLAILGAVEAAYPPGDRLIVNWDEGYVSLLLTRAGEPVLVRTLTGDAAGTYDDIVREVSNTVLYYQEKLGGSGLASVVLRSAMMSPSDAVRLLREPLGLVPEIFDPWAPPGAGDPSPAGQAVAGAAAAVAGKARKPLPKAPLNLATRPVRNERLPALLFLLAAAAVLLVTLQHAFVIYRLRPGASRALHAEVARLTEEQGKLQEEQRQLQLVTVSPQQRQEWTALKSLVDRRTFWWSKVLEILEETVPSRLRILSVSPKVTDDERWLDLTFRVEDDAVGYAFVKTLQSRPEFAQVDPKSFQATTNNEAEFLISMKYLVGQPKTAPPVPGTAPPATPPASARLPEGGER